MTCTKSLAPFFLGKCAHNENKNVCSWLKGQGRFGPGCAGALQISILGQLVTLPLSIPGKLKTYRYTCGPRVFESRLPIMVAYQWWGDYAEECVNHWLGSAEKGSAKGRADSKYQRTVNQTWFYLYGVTHWWSLQFWPRLQLFAFQQTVINDVMWKSNITCLRDSY